MTDTWLMVKETAQYLKIGTDLIYNLAQRLESLPRDPSKDAAPIDRRFLHSKGLL